MSGKKTPVIQSYGLIAFCSDGVTDKVIVQTRRNSYAYIEFMKGSFNEKNILDKLAGMTNYERDLLSKSPNFEDLWTDLWAGQNFFVDCYRHARTNYEKIKGRLPTLIETNYWKDIENYWGFAKGRRDSGESPRDTALREFKEELNIDPTSFTFLPETDTITHTYKGTDRKNYSTVYYVAVSPIEYEAQYTRFPKCFRMVSVSNEVQDAEWKTIKDAREIIETGLVPILDEAYKKFKTWKT